MKTESRWLRRGFVRAASGVVFVTSVATASCSEGPHRESGEATDDSTRGTLAVYAMTQTDGATKTGYVLRINGDERDTRELVFTEDPRLAPWTRLKVWGTETDERIEVARFEIDAEEASEVRKATQALVGGKQLPVRRLGVFVSVSSSDPGREGRFRSAFSLARSYYPEASYGMQELMGEIAVLNPIETCGLTESEMIAQANSYRQQYPEYDHHLVFYIGNGGGGFCQGVSASGSEIGTPSAPGRYSWFVGRGSDSCTSFVRGLSHNFGLKAYGLTCYSPEPVTTVTLADDLGACSESGMDAYDPTGDLVGTPLAGYYAAACYHTNAWHKVARGWLGRCNAVRVRASGTYILSPLEMPCDGPQVLQIPMTRERVFNRRTRDGITVATLPVRFYYLELRTALGPDAALQNTPVVLVRVADDFGGPGESWLLDMDPINPPTSPGIPSAPIDGLHAGQSFTDPAGGVSFKVQTLSQNQATIEVTVPNGSGSSTCLDGTPIVPPGPPSCGVGGAGGAGGTSGASGTGGVAGTTGTAGTTGAAGTSGASSTGGVAGTSGAAGTEGSGGVGGTGGVAGGLGTGANNAGGSSGVSGSSGGDSGANGVGGRAGGSGAGATLGAAGTEPGLAEPRGSTHAEEGGCGCRATPGPNGGAFGLLLMLGLVLRFRRRPE
jgi:MYXO-CTERM domain-containing protein